MTFRTTPRKIAAEHDEEVARIEREARQNLCRKLKIPYQPRREELPSIPPMPHEPLWPWVIATVFAVIVLGYILLRIMP